MSRGVLKSLPLYQRSVPTPVQWSSNDWLLMAMAELEIEAVGRGMIFPIKGKKECDNLLDGHIIVQHILYYGRMLIAIATFDVPLVLYAHNTRQTIEF